MFNGEGRGRVGWKLGEKREKREELRKTGEDVQEGWGLE